MQIFKFHLRVIVVKRKLLGVGLHIYFTRNVELFGQLREDECGDFSCIIKLCQIVVVVGCSVYFDAAVNFDVEIFDEVVGTSDSHVKRNHIHFGVHPIVTAIAIVANFKNGYFISNFYVLLMDFIAGADHLRKLYCVWSLVTVIFDLGVYFDDICVLQFPHGC